MLLAKSLCALMKVVSHLSHTKPSLMCHLLTFLSTQLQNMAVWCGGSCKLRRWREYIILWILQIHRNNSQPGMLWYYVGQSSFIDTTESLVNPISEWRSHCYVQVPTLWELKFLQLSEGGTSFFGHWCYGVSAHSQNTMWYHILRHQSIEPWYTLQYLYQSAIHTSWGKWFDIGEHPLYPQGNCKFGRNQLRCCILTLGMPSHLVCNYHSASLVEFSCTAGSSLLACLLTWCVTITRTTSSPNWHHNPPASITKNTTSITKPHPINN